MAENESDEGEEKKSSKTILIIALVVLLLAGGGAGYFFMGGDPAEGEEGEQTEQVEEEPEEEGANELLYYDMEKPFIINFPKGSGARLIQVSVSILAKGEESIEALKKHQPMIRNNLLMMISGKGAKNLATQEGKEGLRADMLKEVGKIMEQMTGKNKVDNIFFTSFVMQ